MLATLIDSAFFACILLYVVLAFLLLKPAGPVSLGLFGALVGAQPGTLVFALVGFVDVSDPLAIPWAMAISITVGEVVGLGLGLIVSRALVPTDPSFLWSFAAAFLGLGFLFTWPLWVVLHREWNCIDLCRPGGVTALFVVCASLLAATAALLAWRGQAARSSAERARAGARSL